MAGLPGSRTWHAGCPAPGQRRGARRQTTVGKTILIVDDHAPSREGLKDWLRDAGWQVETAASARNAVEKVKGGGFAVVLVDLDLPPARGLADGWDLVRAIRALEPGLAIIAVGAQRESDWAARARRLHVTEVLEKPISPRRLLPIVEALGAAGATHREVAPGVGPGSSTARTTPVRDARGGACS